VRYCNASAWLALLMRIMFAVFVEASQVQLHQPKSRNVVSERLSVAFGGVKFYFLKCDFLRYCRRPQLQMDRLISAEFVKTDRATGFDFRSGTKFAEVLIKARIQFEDTNVCVAKNEL
jgi:hypothetical protein